MPSLAYTQLSNTTLRFYLLWTAPPITPITQLLFQMVRLVCPLSEFHVAITFLNTSSLMHVRPLCTAVALMDNCFRRIAEVEVHESWSHNEQVWTAIGNADA